MIVVGVTGPDGFLGFHVRARLLAMGVSGIRVADRTVFADPAALDAFVAECDHIVHVAGVNRGDELEVANGNIALAAALVAAKQRVGARFSLAYANSVQSMAPGPYGEGKQAAAVALREAQEASADPYLDLVLPHLFGELGRPFYNSAVTTFAHLLATGGQPEVHQDSELELVHAQDAVQRLIAGSTVQGSVRTVVEGTKVSVSEALATLRDMADVYGSGCAIPDVANHFELQMFNMLRSQIYATRPTIPLTVHSDQRGGFYENVRAHSHGQTSISTTVPGVMRGDHFHFDKVERFIVVSGTATIRIRRLFSSAVDTFVVSGAEPVAIDMPTLHTHNITNTGNSELVTQFWSNDHFDPAVADTFVDPVESIGCSA